MVSYRSDVDVTCQIIYLYSFDYPVLLKCAKQFGPVDLQYSLPWFDLKTLRVYWYTNELFQISAG